MVVEEVSLSPAFSPTSLPRVLVGSFNVNGWKCNRELKDWLYMNELPDVVAVGYACARV